jgi:hypothetical protein
VGFIIGFTLLVRHQLAPKRRAAKDRSQDPE